jgi:hypothetical protein
MKSPKHNKPKHKPVKHRQIISSKPKVDVGEVEQATKEFFEQFVQNKEHVATIIGAVYGDKRVEYHNHEHVDVDKTGHIIEPESLSELYPVRQAVRNRNKMVVITVEVELDEIAYTPTSEDGEELEPVKYRELRSWVLLGNSVKPQTAKELEEVYLLDSATGDEVEPDLANKFFDAWELGEDWIK